MLKFWAWIYRKTGWYSPFAVLAEYRIISKTLSSEQRRRIGMWQADNRFVRPFIRNDKTRLDRFRKMK